MDWTRREILLGSGAALTAGCLPERTLDRSRRWAGTAPVAVQPLGVTDLRAGRSPLGAFARVADAVGAPGALAPRRGERRVILVKPAVNSNDPYPANASPDSVAAAVALCRRYDPDASVVVADSSGVLSSGDAYANMRKNGILAAAQRAGRGARDFGVHAFERDGWVNVGVEGADHWSRGFGIPRLMDRVTDIVLVSRVSAHVLAGHTIAIKNFVGCVAPGDRAKFHWAMMLAPKMEELIAELGLAFKNKLRLVLVDARLAQADFGPYSGKIVQPGLVYATRDVVSADVLGLALLRLASRALPAHRRSDRLSMRGPWATTQVRHAAAIGLGPRHPRDIRLLGDALAPSYRSQLWKAMQNRRVSRPPILGL